MRTLFIQTNSSWLVFESNKTLLIKNSILFNLGFANNNILSCFFLFFLIIGFYPLIPAVTAKNFNPIAELRIPMGIPSKEAKVGNEKHQVTTEAYIRKCSIYFRIV